MPFTYELTPTKQIFTVPRCGLCGLYRGCKSPKMKPDGRGEKNILIVGEAPGADEDNQGHPFVGKSGQFLEECLAEVGINMRKDCWMTNSLICRPPKNATPTTEQISYCYPNLKNTLKELKPNLVITVGRPALESIITGIWLEDIGPMGRWVGWQIPCQAYNCWITPTYHPSYISREMENSKSGTPAKAIFLSHLKAASKLKDKPYRKVPKWDRKITVITKTDAAADILLDFHKRGGPISFDYETDSLKPDRDGSIISASVCWRGARTIAFPWTGSRTKKAWEKLMTGDCPKIGHNLKFEDRWTRSKLGIEIKNWVWDTMLNSHVMDNRKWICGLGFQSFVTLGMSNYYSDIGKFLEQKNSYDFNNIRKAPLEKILKYNGLDSLLTYKLFQKQCRQLKMEVPT